MLKKTTPWAIALALWIAGSTYWHVCKIKELCDAPIIESVVTPNIQAQLPTLQLKDGTSFDLTAQGNIKFPRSGNTPDFSEVLPEMAQLQSYLQKNTGISTLLVGYYSSSEGNTTNFPNLGIARAEAIKNYLVTNGANSKTISTEGQLLDDLVFKLDTLIGGVSFAFQASAPALTTSNMPSLTLYFDYGKTTYHTADSSDIKLSKVVDFLKTSTDKKVSLLGFTDDSGTESFNLKLGAYRANVVKKYLQKQGIDASRITVISKGEAEPQSPNDTEEGRKANRRVVISIQ
ncbi:OmpA family protein [Flectobacillus major]|uniref:OmpA family protein n=1 Tax=Flectobacillus major TaxID=103 RepID=UPI0004280324|nr:OmpA family protein [Flectobacillus major]